MNDQPDHGLSAFRISTALEAAEFDRLKKSGYFRRNATDRAAAKAWHEPFPSPHPAMFAAPSVALVDRPEPREVVAEPNEAGAVSIRPLADFDDDVRTFHDDPRQLHLEAVESTMMEIMRRGTGDCADPVKRAATVARRAELQSLTVECADDLETEGIACYRQDKFVVWTEGLHSGIVDEPVRFAHLMMLPSVAARIRQPMLSAAGYFLQSRPFARTAVFTTGPRTRMREVGTRTRKLNRDLSRLNHGLRKRFGVEIVLRSDELGTPESDADGERVDAGEIERDVHGEPTFHVHAHVIMHHVHGRPMSKDQWDQLLRWVSERWGYWWKDCGILRDAAETVKYITKPRELRKLTRPEKAELCRQLRGLKLLQTMGALRREIASREARRMTLDRYPTNDGRVWREILDYNRRGPRRPADATETALVAVCEHGGDPFRVRDDERPKVGETFVGPRVEVEIEARCAAILPPGFMPGSLIREPRAVFFGKRIDLEASQRDPRCVMVRAGTRDEWLAGVAASGIMVHTCTPTVRPAQAEFACANADKGPPSTAGPP